MMQVFDREKAPWDTSSNFKAAYPGCKERTWN